MEIKTEQRTFRRRIPIAFSQLLGGKLSEGVFLNGNATAPCDIVCFPTGFPHSLADVRIFVMEPIPHIVTADCVESLFTKQNGMSWSEFREAGLFSELCFQKTHAPACKNAIRRGGNQASVASADAGIH